MNCFEARQEFFAFWRSVSPPERRAALVEHLGQCGKCDRAFRRFALSAPVLHADAPPEQSGSVLARAAYRRPRVGADSGSTRRWLPMCAALALFAVSGFAAYFSVMTPVDQLTEDLASGDVIAEILGQELSALGNDLGG
jgi:anti-sigma factor RsiW